MPSFTDVFKVYQAGELTVVGFAGGEFPAYDRVGQCRDQLANLLERHDCKHLAFDLTGVPFIASGILGLMISMTQLGVHVHLYNPSEQVQEVLKVTKLDELVDVQFVET